MTRGRLGTRVIAGTLKGRVLRYPSGPALRPTMQRTKGSVFESLRDRIKNAVFVDLYAAAGGMGIEALSRGARRVHFVEKDGAALRCLEENLARCEIRPERGVVHPEPVMDFLRRDALRAVGPTIVYADPPYDSGDILLLLEFFDGIGYPLNGLLVVEHRKDILALDRFERLVRLRVREFGQSCVSYILFAGDGS